MTEATARLALVTGASGFVGSAVARRLVEQGWRVRVLLRPSSDRRNIDGLPVEVFVGALGDGISLAPALAGCSDLFHVAADYRLWVPDPATMFRANVDGTRELMERALAAGLRRIVYTSSVATLALHRQRAPAADPLPTSSPAMLGPSNPP